MSDFVVMPKADWQNALDSARAKAQITDLIKSGDLSAIIDGIKAIGDPVTALAGGTYIPTSTAFASLTIEHNLGVVPNFFAFIDEDVAEDDTYYNLEYAIGAVGAKTDAWYRGVIIYGGVVASSSDTYNKCSNVSMTLQRDDTSLMGSNFGHVSDYFTDSTFKINVVSQSYYLYAGHKYNWVCGVLKGI